MKLRNLMFFVVIVAATVFISYVNSKDSEVRLMSYNVRNAIGVDGVMDYQRIASVIMHADPDVVALQELDSMTRRSRGRDLLASLAGATGMRATFAKAIDYDGGSYGIGVLSKQTPLSVRTVALPGSEEARRLLIVEFKDYVFACTHLSLTEADRMRSVELIGSAASGWEKPFFIAGDWNMEPDDAALQAMQQDFELVSNTGLYTYPADLPTACLDYIGVMRGTARNLEVVSADVIDVPDASDHRPVLVTVDFAVK